MDQPRQDHPCQEGFARAGRAEDSRRPLDEFFQVQANRVPLQEMQEEPQNPLLQDTMRQLQEYFAGTRKSFSIPLDLQGTDFQKKVWNVLLSIPYGETRSYSDIARAIGKPDAVRAVGAANGRNPLSIIVPCHRVIGQNGSLTGYAGGLEIKKMLLDLENSQRNTTTSHAT